MRSIIQVIVIALEGLVNARYHVKKINDYKYPNSDIYKVTGRKGINLNRVKYNVNPRENR